MLSPGPLSFSIEKFAKGWVGVVLLSFLTLPSLRRGMSADPMVVALTSELNSLRQALAFAE
jgi:hypothetical protein